ncbi:MAG: hypothetical protein JW709_11195 [Sedimentisphaerales bacterium]|nr:hypothetical protein [Sedimentisphaerales bacterium]
MQRYIILILWAWLIGVLSVLLGCNNVTYSPAEEARYLKPTIAVMSFENRAQMQTKWNLGDALADQLIDRLMATRRYVVLERAQLNAVMRELKRTQDSRFRKTGAPATGQLKHVKYLVKGVITDFGHVETVEGDFWQLFDWGLLGSSTHAMVGCTVYVVDVESGQVIASESVQAKVKDKKHDDKPINYQGMTFASYSFYHTPLGEATNKMLDEAVVKIARAVAETPYQPKIARVMNGQIVINGGKDRRLEIGDEYVVRPSAEQVFDPDTGDLLGHITGEPIGLVRIVNVTDQFAIGEIVSGDGFAPGQTLFHHFPETAQAPAVKTNY